MIAILRHRTLMLVGILLLTALQACSTTRVAKDPLSNHGSSSEEVGTVLVSLTLNTGEVTQFQTVWLERIEDRGAGGGLVTRGHRLDNAVPGASRDTALFVGTLPPGAYRFKQLTAHPKFLNINDAQNQLIGSFKVETGKVADLGRLLLTAANFKVLMGRSPSVTANNELLDRIAPRYKPLFEQAKGGGWTKESEQSASIEAFAKAYPQGATGFSELSNGEVIGGTRLGTVLARNVDGKWRILARTGRLDAVLFTTPYEKDGYVGVAVGELGTFLKVRADGRVDHVDSGDLPRGNYFFVAKSPEATQWFVGVQTPESAVLYTASTLDGGHWTVAKRDSIKPSLWSGARNVWMWPYRDGIGYASSDARAVYCFDYTASEWRRGATPGDRIITSIATTPEGVIGILTQAGGGFGGVFAETHYTKDCGATWTQTDSPYKVKVSPPIVLASGTVLASGGVFGEKGMHQSKDGRYWTKITKEAVSLNDNIWVLPTKGIISVSRGQFGFESVRHSADGAHTWTVEFTSINRTLLNNQKAKSN